MPLRPDPDETRPFADSLHGEEGVNMPSGESLCVNCHSTLDAETEVCPNCQHLRPELGWPVDPLVGESIVANQYRVIRRIGAGGFGVVYEVETVVGGLRRALKVLSRRWAEHAVARERLVNEALALEQVNHPNVARCYAAGTLEDGSLYLLLELVDGIALSQLAREDGVGEHHPLPPLRAVRIVKQVASGLAVAHKNGVLHRDIKPDNVLILSSGDPDEQVKVIDFGIAKFLIEDSAATLNVVGTPAFMAPEQLTPGSPLDARLDLWQLGALLYLLLVGRPHIEMEAGLSFSALREKHEAFELRGPFPSQVNRELAGYTSLDSLVSRLLASDPVHRVGSAAEVCEELARIEHLLEPVSSSSSSLALLKALASEPSESSWWALCRFIQSQSSDRDRLISAAQVHLRSWPDEYRRAPCGWWETIKRGEEQPLWSLVRSLDLSNRDLNDDDVSRLATFSALGNLSQLDLAGNSFGNQGVQALVGSRHLSSLVHLDVSGNRITSEGVSALASSENLPELRSLNLADNGIGERGVVALAGSKNLALERLDLSGNEVRSGGASALAASENLGAMLRELRLAAGGIGAEGMTAIAMSTCLTGLQLLDVGHNALGPTGAEALSQSRCLGQLRSLRVARNSIGQRGLETLLESKGLEALLRLDLSSNEIGPAGAMSLASSPLARRINALDLSDNDIGDAGLVALISTPQLATLKTLNLCQTGISSLGSGLLGGAQNRIDTLDVSNNVLGPAAGAELGSAIRRMGVHTLRVSGCGLSGEGLATILREASGQLVSVDAGNNPIGEEGAAVLSEVSELCRLTSLNLRDTRLGADGTDRITSCVHLTNVRHLDLSSNGLGDQGVVRLMCRSANLPRLEVLHLQDNYLGLDSAIAIANSSFAPHLVEVDLGFNKLGNAGAEALARHANWHSLRVLKLAKNGIALGSTAAILASPSMSTLHRIDLANNAIGGLVDLHSLSQEKVHLLEESFGHLSGMGLDLTETFYKELFSRHPGVKPLFAHVSMHAQKQHLFSSLVLVIENLRQPELVEKKLQELGERHLGYGVYPSHYHAVSSTMLEVIRRAAGNLWNEKLHEAWAEGLEAITNVMMKAHDGPRSVPQLSEP